MASFVIHCRTDEVDMPSRFTELKKTQKAAIRANTTIATHIWGELTAVARAELVRLTQQYFLSVAIGDLILLDGRWYVTHSGLLGIASRRRCNSILATPLSRFCDSSAGRWAFRATVYTSPSCRGFVGYGDADPSNVSPLVHGAEMRVAETRAVNRALRKAYGIGICSVEEIGSATPQPASRAEAERQVRKLPPDSSDGNRNNGCGNNGKANGIRVRDRLCQLIRSQSLDADLVKAYAIDFCGTRTLREASREQVENFVVHLADWAEKDRNALLCQLNSYSRPQAGAA
jgi:hypothetical protein